MRNTKYAVELQSASIGESRIERIFVKSLKQEEIRLSWWPGGRMAPRPVDVPEADLVAILAKGIQEGVLSPDFLPRLIEAARLGV